MGDYQNCSVLYIVYCSHAQIINTLRRAPCQQTLLALQRQGMAGGRGLGGVRAAAVVALGGTPTRGQHSPTGVLRHQGPQPLPPAGMGRKLAVLLHLDSLG